MSRTDLKTTKSDSDMLQKVIVGDLEDKSQVEIWTQNFTFKGHKLYDFCLN